MRPAVAMLALATLGACPSVQLARLESQLDGAEDELEEFQQNVETLREEMIALGMVSRQAAKAPEVASGPQSAVDDHQLPERELSGVYPFVAHRSGTPAPLPPLPPIERTDSPCGWKVKVEPLKPISDFVLNKADLGKASPVRLLENGRQLTPHAFPKDFEEACNGSFRHAGFLILFSPSGTPEAAEQNSYTLQLAEDVPLPRGGDGRPMYWVYPGTTLTLEMADGWDAEWGNLWANVSGRTTGPAGSPLHIRIANEDVLTFDGPVIAASIEPDFPQEAWSIQVTSPPDGPYAVFEQITLGNATNALVITGERAWQESRK